MSSCDEKALPYILARVRRANTKGNKEGGERESPRINSGNLSLGPRLDAPAGDITERKRERCSFAYYEGGTTSPRSDRATLL